MSRNQTLPASCGSCVNEFVLIEDYERSLHHQCPECGQVRAIQYSLDSLTETLQKNEASLNSLQAHAAEVRVLLIKSTEMVTINTVGLVAVNCHRSLLEYYLPSLVSEEVEFIGYRVLDSHSASTVKAVFAWLYTGCIVTTDETDEQSEALAKLWVLGQELRCARLCNAVMVRILDHFEKHGGHALSPPTIDFVFRNTLSDSKLRLIFTHLIEIYLPLQRPWDHSQAWQDYFKQGSDSAKLVRLIEGPPTNEQRLVQDGYLPYHRTQRNRYFV